MPRVYVPKVDFPRVCGVSLEHADKAAATGAKRTGDSGATPLELFEMRCAREPALHGTIRFAFTFNAPWERLNGSPVGFLRTCVVSAHPCHGSKRSFCY